MSAQEIILNGRYRLITQHGSGGMSVVYKAQDLRLGRIVAVKILRPSLTTDPSFLQRFQQEARNVANLAHPNIVTLHDFGQDGNNYYMVMEFIDGQDLKKIIRASAPFSVERALHVAIQICAGIGYAHRAGLVHADVKPQNILITGNDTVKVTDFGIAQALSVAQNMERQSVVWGSPHYFAPEQATGEPPNTASDVYAIGIVTFEMLTGRLPYSGSDQQELAMAHIREQVPHVTDFNPNVPIYLDRIVYKVMSKEPSQRYRMADQLGRILMDYQKRGQEFTANVAPASGSPAPAPSSAPVASAQPVPLRPAVTGNTPPPQPAQPQPQQIGQSGGGASGFTPPNPQPAQPQQSYAPSGTGPLRSPQPNSGIASGVNLNSPTNNSGVPGAYPPQSQAGGYLAESSGYRPVAPTYAAPPRSNSLDAVSIILAVIAFVAVIGLVLLWLAVLGAYR
ncbi:MAG: serine/threonine protein kinase [Anaerolineae bacterium]|nr:serine/threonine protein kinase [Anaerolineae bacterium]